MEKIDIIEQHIADRSLDLLKIILKDKSTGIYIKWATDNYADYGEAYSAEKEMFPEMIIGNFTNIIQPRVSKSVEEQTQRTRDKAEVFTPTWIVNAQNNLVDEAWFQRKNVFNTPKDNSWITTAHSIPFTEEKTWQQYVELKRLEISCGEAPYLVTRYDTVTGEEIPINERVGLLDRKMRVINENIDNELEWEYWTLRAFQSIYGYEYQGDNVLLARENLLYTYWDNMYEKFGHEPTLLQQKKIANIVSWNIWQMDGITMTAPYSVKRNDYVQLSLFGAEEPDIKPIPCKIFDWRSNYSLEFRTMMRGN